MPTIAGWMEEFKARDDEWGQKSNTPLPLSFFATELAGEIGELCNEVKKLERERYGLPGSRTNQQKIADELADGFICLFNMALRLGIDPAVAVPNKFNETSVEVGLKSRMKTYG